jgi:hypothetical protein
MKELIRLQDASIDSVGHANRKPVDRFRALHGMMMSASVSPEQTLSVVLMPVGTKLSGV